MQKLLNDLLEYRRLSETEAYELMRRLVLEPVNDAHTAALLSVFIMRDIGLAELTGFRKALMELAVPFSIEGETIDMCGTGGDGKNTFNISTLAAFVVAGTGVKVAKHGNYGVSSVSGSSDVMEYLGYTFTNNTDALKAQLNKSGICFIHAPLFHPALKKVAGVRKQMGIKTFFNMLGPLVNPVNPTHHYTGTYSLQLARLYNYLFQQQQTKYIVVHALDGYDEISLTGACKVYSQVGEYIFTPQEWGFTQLNPEELFGGNTIREAAKIFVQVLEGKGTVAQQAVVTVNAAAALSCVCPNRNMDENIAAAKESLQSGKAFEIFKTVIQ